MDNEHYVDFDVKCVRLERWNIVQEAIKLLIRENPDKFVDGNRIKMVFVEKESK